MGIADLLFAPIVALLLYGVAFLVRPWVTYEENRKYFIPALTLKFIGAISLGLLYQYYYTGGDTFNYFSDGAKYINQAFYDQPKVALNLIFNQANYEGGVYKYASHIWMYRDPTSYMVIRIAGIFAILSGGTYSGTALLFAAVSFSGLWAMYMAFCKLFPKSIYPLALAILFIPSTVIWGSGILKDSVTFGMLGWSTAAVIHLLYWPRKRILWVIILLFALWLAFNIKEYIVLSFVPAAMVWTYFIAIKKVPNKMLKVVIGPFVMVIIVVVSSYIVYKVGENSPRYSLANLAETARVTAYDIGRWTGRDAGSGYDLGDFDGTFFSMIRLAPAAINVSLFRPYLWEVRNPLMLMASLEGMLFLVLTVIILFRMFWFKINVLKSPAAWFCIVFSLTFAFAVGISTYNFGTLFRYKVPLMPFFAILLVLAWTNSTYQISDIRKLRKKNVL